MKRPVLNKILVTCSISAIILYVVVSLYGFTEKRKNKICEQINIVLADQGKNKLIDTESIELQLKSQQVYPVGKAIKDISTEKIENVLQQNGLIKSSECYFTPNGTVRVRIHQCIPKFRVIGQENYYIDTDRKKINPVDYTAYVPVVSGYVTYEMASGELFDFITFLEKNSFWNAQIEQIYVRPDHKIELVPRVSDSIILLGSLENYPAKLDKLKKLYVNGFNKIGWNRYKTIDLQYKGQIVCTKK